MAGNAREQEGGSLKRRSPGELRVVRASGNEISFEEEIVMANHSTTVIPFNFGKQQVRTLLLDGQPWFVASDVCASLAVANVSLAVNGRADRESDGLDSDEKGIASVNTPSGTQDMLIVSESGLYALIFKSRKAEAKRFKKWVTAEVLPAIRKYGRYEDSIGKMTTLIGHTIGTDGVHMLGSLIKGKVSMLPMNSRRRATAKIWSQIHAAFGVRSAEDIPADQLDAARNFVAAYAVQEGEYLPKARATCITLELPTELSPIQRFMVTTDGSGTCQIQPIPIDACVMTPVQFLGAVVAEQGIHVPPGVLFDFAMSALAKVQWRIKA